MHETRYENYVERVLEKAKEKGTIPPRSNIVYYGKEPNKIRVQQKYAEDPGAFCSELALFIYKEAELIEYDEE